MVTRELTTSFYDGLAEIYDLIYEDWPASIQRQAKALKQVIRERFPGATTILDVACGIGTQCLGLAAAGFSVTGSDISAAALERARREAVARDLSITFRIDDMQRLSACRAASTDVLIACDNAVPHLLTDDQIESTLRRFHEVVRPGGLCILSVRDYDTADREGVRFVPYGVRERDGKRVIVFQVWAFSGELYDLAMYFTFDGGGNDVITRTFRAKYYAVPISRLMQLARDAGFVSVERLDDLFFQPLIVARRANTA